MGDWAELENESSDVLTEHYGESARLMPRTKSISGDVNARTTADTSRDEVELEVIFEWLSQDAFLGKGKTTTRAPGADHVQSRTPVIYVEERDLGGAVIKEGDRIALLEGANAGLYFEVLKGEPDGQGRVCFHLQQIGKHPIVRT